MKTYKILFSNNIIQECIEEGGWELRSKTPICHKKDGQLAYILVKANSESQARSIAKYTVLELRQKEETKKLKTIS